MSPHLRAAAAGVLAMSLLSGPARGAAPPCPAAPYRVSGPFSHQNLAVFFLHGDDLLAGKKLLTLDESIASKKVVVHETKDINKVAVENLGDLDVFVQAGDIVKGGRSDRVLGVDLIVPAGSGKVPVPSFCVEVGRWQQRGNESASYFDSSKNNVIGNKLKLAVRLGKGSPNQVWRGVCYEQLRLQQNLHTEVKDAESESSLQLTLENKKLLSSIDGYVKKLGKSLDEQQDVIGFAVAINGKVQSADVYASAALFRKLWPKALACSATEAVAEAKEKGDFRAAKAADVFAFLALPGKGKASDKRVNKEFEERQQETDTNVLIETRSDKGVLRRSYLAK